MWLSLPGITRKPTFDFGIFRCLKPAKENQGLFAFGFIKIWDIYKTEENSVLNRNLKLIL